MDLYVFKPPSELGFVPPELASTLVLAPIAYSEPIISGTLSQLVSSLVIILFKLEPTMFYNPDIKCWDAKLVDAYLFWAEARDNFPIAQTSLRLL